MTTKLVELESEIASSLLSIGAVSLKPQDPFTWASGLRSPIYCDNRMVMGYPEVRAMVTAGFADVLASSALQYDVIAGTATAGIPHAAWLAYATEKPMVYVRSKPKGHGRKKQIEGPVNAGDTAVVIEDLISTGKSSIAAVEALQAAGVKVTLVLAIFSYGFESAAEVFKSAGIPFQTLTNFETLISIAEKEGVLREDELATMQRWRLDPKAWSAAFQD